MPFQGEGMASGGVYGVNHGEGKGLDDSHFKACSLASLGDVVQEVDG